MFDDVIEGAQHEAKLHENGALIVYVNIPKQLIKVVVHVHINMCIRGGYEAAVIYFRTAYSPAHYLSQKVSSWKCLCAVIISYSN